MSFMNPRNPAEACDSLVTLTAAAMALVALLQSANVIEFFAPEAVTGLLGTAQSAGAVLVVGVFGPLFIFLKFRGATPAAKSSSGGYIGALLRQTALSAFSATIAFMVMLSVLGERVLSRFTAEVALDLVISFAFGSFAVSFFIINRFRRVDDGLVNEG